MSANATTRLLFGTSLKSFLFDGWTSKGTQPQAGGTFSQAVTLAELFGQVYSNQGAPYGVSTGSFPGGLSEVVMTNIQGNWPMALGTYALSAAIPKILVKTGTQRNANKLLKGFGLSSVVQL